MSVQFKFAFFDLSFAAILYESQQFCGADLRFIKAPQAASFAMNPYW